MLLLTVFSGCLAKNPQIARTDRVIFANKLRTNLASAEATGTHFAISTQGEFASKAAQQMFEQGGNIVDAAVAASFVISVERPQSTGLGGGGFLLFHQAKTGQTMAFDFRERAPLDATEKMYLGADGKPDVSLSRNGIMAVAVPGLVAGLLEIHEKYGRLPRARVIQPAVDLAEKGFPVYEELANGLRLRQAVLEKNPAAKKIFFDDQGKPLALGAVLVQKDLAWTLRHIAKNGKAGFYRGPVAKKILHFAQQQKGLLRAEDLAVYEVKQREVVRGEFHGYRIVSMPPPSSGGVHVIQFLSFLEHDDVEKLGLLSAPAIHLAASSLQSAFADRAKYLGDPDFVKVPVAELTSAKYNEQRRSEVFEDKARPQASVQPGHLQAESTQTTHLSVIDAEGNAISTTQTINGLMGSAVVVPGTGIVLNNEMDDFSAQEGALNMFGAVGGLPNAIAPRKTPLSSMSPTLVLKDGHVLMSVGAPGGTRIISCVAQTILNYFAFHRSLFESVAMIRYHHQWQPDFLDIDPPGPDPQVLQKLQAMGYQVRIKDVPCKVMAVTNENGVLHAVADPRDIGTGVAQ